MDDMFCEFKTEIQIWFSKFLNWASDNIAKISPDEKHFIACQFVTLLAALLYRLIPFNSDFGVLLRHLCSALIGVLLGVYTHGKGFALIIILPIVCYILMLKLNTRYMHYINLVMSCVYLSIIKINFMIISYGKYSMDYTGPLMIILQKITSLSFNFYDGVHGNTEDLSENQTRYRIQEIPGFWQYCGYVFNFHTLAIGPAVFYKDYLEFIDGSNIAKHEDENSTLKPFPFYAVIRKTLLSMIFAIIYVSLSKLFPIERLKQSEFLETDLVFKTLYIMAAVAGVKYKYFHAWILADAIANASDFGFNGYGTDGNARWDLISNVDVMQCEFGLSLRESIAGWNISTTKWLRVLVYDRVPMCRIFLTFAASALWHGFYPGYYITFVSGALFTYTERRIRRFMRSLEFESSTMKKAIYDIITCSATRILLPYTAFSFIIFEFWASVTLYYHMYFWAHILAIILLLLIALYSQLSK